MTFRDRVSTHIFANAKVAGKVNRDVCGILLLEHRVECFILRPVGLLSTGSRSLFTAADPSDTVPRLPLRMTLPYSQCFLRH